MRKYLASLVVLAFLLFALGMMAQTTPSGSEHQSGSSTTTTTTAQATTTTGAEQSVEGCLRKEGSDFFLIPAEGNPIELQASAGEDISAHEGHKVKVHGVESSLSASSNAGASGTGGAAGTAASANNPSTSGTQSSAGAIGSQSGSSASGTSGAASSSGSDLHKLASKQMTVAKLDHIAASCPADWNPSVSPKSESPKQ